MSRRRNAESTWGSISTRFSETNLAHLFQAQSFALYSGAAGQSQTFALPEPVLVSRYVHISSPTHDDKTVHEASAQKCFLVAKWKNPHTLNSAPLSYRN